MTPIEWIFAVIIGLAILGLLFQPWFWIAAFAIGGLAAAFTTLAAVIHFEILLALVMFFLTGLCWIMAGGILEWTSRR